MCKACILPGLKLSTLNAFKLRPKLQLCRTMLLSRPLRCLTFLLAMLVKPVSPRKGSLAHHAKERAPPPANAKPGAPAPAPPSQAASVQQANCSDAVSDRLSAASRNTSEPKIVKRRRITKQDIADADEGFALSYNTTKPTI